MSKTRLGFVSNSSSSSFICNVCGNVESGYDASLSDFDMSSCENGHEFCNDHMTRKMSDLTSDEIINYAKNGFKYMNEKSKAEYIVNLESAETHEDLIGIIEDMNDECYGGDSEVLASLCPICSFSHVNSGDIRRYLEKIHGISAMSALEEIKKKTPDRNYMEDEEYNEFVLNKIKRTEGDVIDEIVKKFNHDYSAFLKFFD